MDDGAKGVKSNTIATGLAMFSMFFGAGNVVFPLALGQHAKDQNFWAIIGLLITGVGVPFLGLVSMSLFDGNYRRFFERIGKIPGFLVAAIILALIGPFGAMPRCITLAYATSKDFLPDIGLLTFSAFSCVLIFLCTFRKNKLLDLLGLVLTPVLLLSLALIVIMGLWNATTLPPSTDSSLSHFLRGLTQGYQLMDLLGAFFFSAVVLNILEQGLAPDDRGNHVKMIKQTLKAGIIGVTLLGLTYTGFSYVAAYHSDALIGVNASDVIAALAKLVLGPYGSIVACIAVAVACLTTAIALSVVFAEFLHEDIFQEQVGYIPSLLITLVIGFVVSTFNFNGIVYFLAPILIVCYPALIVLSILNIAYKLKHFRPVKVPVFVTFALSLVYYTIF